jgi:hyperosmotically inducible protein
MKRVLNRMTLGLAIVALVAPALVWATTGSTNAPRTLNQKVRHELLMLPFYTVFDNLQFQVEGSKVILSGQVTRPVVKSDAATVVKGIPGVTAVENNIEVLPLSPMDNHIRWETLRAIYRQPVLSRYGLGANPSIHIIVKNGHVTLDGVVDNQADKDIAGIRANGVPGVFSVTNNLRVG